MTRDGGLGRGDNGLFSHTLQLVQAMGGGGGGRGGGVLEEGHLSGFPSFSESETKFC